MTTRTLAARLGVTIALVAGMGLIAVPATAAVGDITSDLPNGATLDFGEVFVGETVTRQITYTNTTGAPLPVVGPSGGVPGDNFSGSGACNGQTLAPGGTCVYTFTFTPQVAGVRGYDHFYHLNDDLFTFRLLGTGISRFVLDPGDGGLFFDPVYLGESSSQVLKLVNLSPGTATPDFSLGPISDSERGPAFEYGGGSCDGPVPSGGECELEFDFLPPAPQALVSTLTLTLDGEAHPVTLQGTGMAPFVLNPADGILDFGDVPLGVSGVRTLTVTNASSIPQEVSRAGGAFHDPIANAGHPSIYLSDFCYVDGPIAPGGTCRLDVRFTPTELGPAEGRTGVSLDGAVHEIRATGTGVPAVITPDPARQIDFGTVEIGSTAVRELTLTNSSPAPQVLSITGAEPTRAEYRVEHSCQDVTLEPGASCTLRYTFAPVGSGWSIEELAITIDDAGGVMFPTLRGRGVEPGSDGTPGNDQGGENPGGTDDGANGGEPGATEGSDDERLSDTGGEPAWALLGIGALLAALGGAAVLVTRRRRTE